MNDLFNTGKKMLMEQLKKKILLALAPALPWIIGIMAGLILILMALGPIVNAIQKVQDFGQNVGGFFESIGTKTGNLFAGRGFIIIDQEAIEKKEDEFNTELQKIYEKFRGKVKVDAPLILATVHYPLNVSYDEDTFICLNLDKDLYSNDDEYEAVKARCKEKGLITGKEEQYDYYSEKKVKMYILVSKMIELTTYEYECNAREVESEGETFTIYERGDLVSTETEPLQEDANKHNIKNDESCNSTSNINTYKYSINLDNYDEYLRSEYIMDAEEFGIEGYPSEEQADRIEQTIFGIHDLTDYYYYIFEDALANQPMIYGSIPADVLKEMVVPLDPNIGSDGKGNYVITSCFGPRQLDYEKEGRLHTGIDISGMRGGDLNIRAAADGIVEKIVDIYPSSFNCYGDCDGAEGAGNYVNIKHTFNGVTYTTRYLHLASVEAELKEGEPVDKGQIIGVMGDTGNSSGTHLHFEMRDSNYDPINPGNLFTNPYKINDNSGCSVLSYDCSSKNSVLVMSPLYAKWRGSVYPVEVRVNDMTMPLEQYVLGVSLNEAWPHYHVEALKAQAIAARTYTFGGYRFLSFKTVDRKIVINMGTASEATQTFNLNRLCDLSQEYQNNFLQAIETTRGQVLANKNTGNMFSSEYSSCAANAYGSTLGNGYVYKLPGQTQTVQSFCVSSNCYQNGRNVCGHGRGMSQSGSNFLANNQGYSYVQIINHYYDADIINLADIDLSMYEKLN